VVCRLQGDDISDGISGLAGPFFVFAVAAPVNSVNRNLGFEKKSIQKAEPLPAPRI
jgi:hypothetical protein